MKFMLDTNAYNALLNNDISIEQLKGEFFTTHIPEDELNNTKDDERRKQLNAKFKEVQQKEISTESAVWDTSKWNKSKWTESNTPTESFVLRTSRLSGAKLGNGSIYHELLSYLEKAKPKDRGNIKDALIGETAIKNEYVLVTNDIALQNAVQYVCKESKLMNFHAFIEVMKNEKRN